MPLRLKTTRLWTLVLAAVLVAGAVSAMSTPNRDSGVVTLTASSAI